MTFLLLLTIILAFYIKDLVQMYKEKRWLLFSLFSALTILIFILSLLITIGISIPSPSEPLKKLIDVIWHLG